MCDPFYITYKAQHIVIGSEIRNTAASYYKNLRGWRTNRKIVVIESDDWGSIRMPSREVYEKCLMAGYRVDQNPYERYDSLASEDDLELLFDVLASFRDKNGKHPVITANCLTSNPDFEKIEDSGFQEYYFESILDTFKKYPKHANCFSLWLEGASEGVFRPQSHGREHLNVSKFMRALQNKDPDIMFGFAYRMPGCIPKNTDKGRNRYVGSTRYDSEYDKQEKRDIILDGLSLFEELFGYTSTTFIPPNYTWSRDFDEPVYRSGVRFLQGYHRMNEPQMDGTMSQYRCVFGAKNKAGIRYLNRNAIFEPTEQKLQYKAVHNCLKAIQAAFIMKKPAIISSHRINYVGFIDPDNRDRNLILLRSLLTTIIKRWPDVEFMSSDQLGQHITDTVQ